MPPFKLPDFYVPWPARINPNLEAARAHSKTWACRMGILGVHKAKANASLWDEPTFDRHDYALFCAYIHPEAPSDDLNLMTDWNVWAFYVDDYFIQVYKSHKDHAGAKKYLDRVSLFMPADLRPRPEPTNPMERGLADLWSRTAPTKSEAWRCRFIESTRSTLEAFLWELDSMSQQRLANPIEYIEIRRQYGGTLWAADLLEHAMLVKIPERIIAARPIQVLRETFADAVHLRNDLFSYEREVLRDGELTNAVLVFERFLGVDTQRAADLVNDLLTSRLQQFEHTVLTELVPMFQEQALDPLEQANVLHYIRGLQDYQSGAHEWHVRSGRYLDRGAAGQTSNANDLASPALLGFGMAAMYIPPDTLRLSMNRFKNYNHIPYQKVGPICLPQFYMPFTTTINPHLEMAQQRSKAWARQMGMFDTLLDCPTSFLWDEDRFDTAQIALNVSLAYPTATTAELDTITYWLVWAFYAEDYFMDVYGRTYNIAGAKLLRAQLWAFMPVESASPASVPFFPIERGLSDVWTHATENLSVDQRRLFRKSVDEMLESWIWELSNQIQHRIPDPIDYIGMRRKTSGSNLFFFIRSRSAQDREISSEVHSTLIMRELSNAAIDYGCLTNDIFSYRKEIEFEGDIHNGVLVIQNFLGCDPTEAVEIANNLMTARVKQFERIAATELPLLFEDLGLDAKTRQGLLEHVTALQHIMAGSLQWHIMTKRYDESSLRDARGPKLLGGGPTGLGTAAARILEIISSQEPAIPYSEQAKQALGEAPPRSKTFAVSHLGLPFVRKQEEAQADNSFF
jgi:germacradienol/geosmin synthase